MKSLVPVFLTIILFSKLGWTDGKLLGPTPQFQRADTLLLDGPWQFAYDGKTVLKEKDAEGHVRLLSQTGEDRGEQEHWYRPENKSIDQQGHMIVVPYPYESKNSGIGRPDEIHTMVWYKKTFPSPTDINNNSSLLLRFGAVDFDTRVWVNGKFVGRHVGGHTGFEFDIAPFLNKAGHPNTIVFSAYDDVRDATQRTGKQRPTEHAIFYKHTTGAWRSITLEKTTRTHLKDVRVNWVGDTKNLEFEPAFSENKSGLRFRVKLYNLDRAGKIGSLVEDQMVETGLGATKLSLHIENPRLWFPVSASHPEWQPNLYHLEYELLNDKGDILDSVTSYTGLRTIKQENGYFHINDQPLILRGVLNQLYREDTQIAAPEKTIKDEIRKTLKSGYNFARLHQSFDPRALAWADRMGLLVSAEAPSAEHVTSFTEERNLNELKEIVIEARNHPSVIEIVDTNESWGLHFIDKRFGAYRDLFAKDPVQADAMRQFNIDYIKKSQEARRSLLRSGHSRDGAPGFSILPDANGTSYGMLLPGNDGWDETEDNNSVHFHRYDRDGEGTTRGLQTLPRHPEANYPLPAADPADLPADQLKYPYTQGYTYNRTPVYLSEYGGVGYVDKTEAIRPGTWGYSGMERDRKEFALRVHGLFAALSRTNLAGYTYTQLKRTGFEVNGTLTEYGVPILPLKMMKAITTIGEYPNKEARAVKVREMIIKYFDREDAKKNAAGNSSPCSKLLDLKPPAS